MKPDLPPQLLLPLISGVLNDPEFPNIVALPVCEGEDKAPVGCILVINLDQKHDRKIAENFRALLARLLELNLSCESPEKVQMMRDAIAACKSTDEVVVKWL